MRRAAICLLLCGLTLFAGGSADGQGKVGQPAPDFPPGLFSDGKTYSLKDLRGKVVVLYFFEMKAAQVAAAIPDYNDLIKSMRDKPIKFLAVGTGDPIGNVTAYQQLHQLQMPIFADSLGLMTRRYSVAISTTAYSAARVINPDGTVAGSDMTRKGLEALLEKTKPEWKYKGKGYEANLNAAIDLLEFGHHLQAMRTIGPYRRDLNKKLSESANKLFEEMQKEGEAWKKRADEAAEEDEVLAYDLYTKIAAVFAGTDLGKAAAEPLKKLGQSKDIAKELAARKAFIQLRSTLSTVTAAQKPFATRACKDVARRFPDTPSGMRAEALADEIGP